MRYITTIDFILFPIYLFFLYFLIKFTARKYGSTQLRKYFIVAFFLHMLGSFLYAMLIQFYYGYGDSFGFFAGSDFIRDYISKGGNPLQIFFTSSESLGKLQNMFMNSGLELPTGISSEANFTIMKISAALSYISFNSYLVISLFFGLFSFAGLWKLFGTFNQILDKKAEKILAYSILYTPSIFFWGSGLMKDSVCLGLTGFIVYFFYKLFVLKKNKNNKHVAFIFICVFIVYFEKLYRQYFDIFCFVKLCNIYFEKKQAKCYQTADSQYGHIGKCSFFNYQLVFYHQLYTGRIQRADRSFQRCICQFRR